MDRVFGFQDIEYADDTNLVTCHLISLRVLTTCDLTEAARCGFAAKNEPNAAKGYLIVINSDLAHANIIVRDLRGCSSCCN